MTARATIEDLNGRPVELTEERWGHVVERHPEIEPLEQRVLRALEAPDRHLSGRVASEEWFYLRTDSPSNWLKVVVAYAEGRGLIVTAFARRSNAMTITIGSSTFDNVFYDADVDVLYLHIGDPSAAVDFDESPEGHALRFDDQGRLVGVTIVGAKSLIDRDGEIAITLPEVVHVASDTVAPALASV